MTVQGLDLHTASSLYAQKYTWQGIILASVEK